MVRSAWKLPYIDRFMFRYLDEEKLYPKNLERSPMVKIQSRNSVVNDMLVGHKFGIHTGRGFSRVVISLSHLGHKMGALVLTKNVGASMHLYNKVQKKKKEKQRALKQKKLNRNKTKKVTARAKLKKSQRLKQKKKKEI